MCQKQHTRNLLGAFADEINEMLQGFHSDDTYTTIKRGADFIATKPAWKQGVVSKFAFTGYHAKHVAHSLH